MVLQNIEQALQLNTSNPVKFVRWNVSENNLPTRKQELLEKVTTRVNNNRARVNNNRAQYAKYFKVTTRPLKNGSYKIWAVFNMGEYLSARNYQASLQRITITAGAPIDYRHLDLSYSNLTGDFSYNCLFTVGRGKKDVEGTNIADAKGLPAVFVTSVEQKAADQTKIMKKQHTLGDYKQRKSLGVDSPPKSKHRPKKRINRRTKKNTLPPGQQTLSGYFKKRVRKRKRNNDGTEQPSTKRLKKPDILNIPEKGKRLFPLFKIKKSQTKNGTGDKQKVSKEEAPSVSPQGNGGK